MTPGGLRRLLQSPFLFERRNLSAAAVYPLAAQQRLLLKAVSDLQAPLSQSEVQARWPLNAQSNALASLLLDYQLRYYPLQNKTGLLLSPEALQVLDSAIKARFVTLIAAYPEHAAALRKLKSTYQFVHAQRLQSSEQAHDGAEFYLSRVVVDLDELAITVEDAAMAVSEVESASATSP